MIYVVIADWCAQLYFSFRLRRKPFSLDKPVQIRRISAHRLPTIVYSFPKEKTPSVSAKAKGLLHG